MEFEFSPRTRQYMDHVGEFMDKHIYPSEHTYQDQLDRGPTPRGRSRRSWRS